MVNIVDVRKFAADLRTLKARIDIHGNAQSRSISRIKSETSNQICTSGPVKTM